MSAIIACCQNCDYSRECSGTTDYDLLFACARDNYLVHADDWCCHFSDSRYREHLKQGREHADLHV